MIDGYGIELLYICCGLGNRIAMLLLGSHQFFNSPSPFSGSRLLIEAARTLISQALYTFAISQIFLSQLNGNSHFLYPFRSTGTEKGYHSQMQSSFPLNGHQPWLWNHSFECLLPYKTPSHYNTLYSTVEGDNEHNITCLKCSIDVEIYKFVTELRQFL